MQGQAGSSLCSRECPHCSPAQIPVGVLTESLLLQGSLVLSREGESQEEAFSQVRRAGQLGVPWGWGRPLRRHPGHL